MQPALCGKNAPFLRRMHKNYQFHFTEVKYPSKKLNKYQKFKFTRFVPKWYSGDTEKPHRRCGDTLSKKETNRMKKLLSLVLAAAMSLSLAACSTSGSSTSDAGNTTSATTEDLPVIKVAVMPFLNSLPIVYMQENGLDVANGFKMETV